MANKRMVSLHIVDTDAFLEMPVSSQLLYFHLLVRADDEGFIGNPKKIMKMVGSNDDDMKVLITKRFVLTFNSGVMVIKHWLIHNTIRMDRFNPTRYEDEKKTLGLKENMAYTDDLDQPDLLELTNKEKPEYLKKRELAMKESDLPYSFNYKIKNAFIGRKCPICTVEMRPQEMSKNCMPTIQHNTPLSLGGKHELGNISVICHNCNVSYQDKPTDKLNAEEVINVWKTIGNQSAPQVKLSKAKLSKVSGEANASPSQIMSKFLEDEEYFNKMVGFIAENKTAPQDFVLKELKAFKSYWSELNKSGTKQRWEMEKTFELQRRLGTWFNNSQKFSGAKKKQIII